jgi:hypothetical protein
MNQPAETIQQRIRFEEVSPANTDAAFLDASIESLVVPLGLPIYDGYDGLDELQLTFLTLPSGSTVTLASYLNSPQPGTSIHVDSAMQNIPQVVFESCQQLQVSREEAIWFHPDWQEEIDRLYAEHGSIKKRSKLSRLEELTQNKQYEPIDCFNHALRIYTREYVPATYWAMLQHNLGLAYFNRSQGDRIENLGRSIECFNKSLEVCTRNAFPDKWEINHDDLKQSKKQFDLLNKQILVKEIITKPMPFRKLKNADLTESNLKSADLRYADLSDSDLSGADPNSEIIRLLKQSGLISPLQRELIIDAAVADVICSQEEIFSAYKDFYQKHQINSDADRAKWLESNHFTLDQFEHLVFKLIKFERFKQNTFGHKVDSYFLQRKSQLDRVIYSLLRVKDSHLAQELYFRVQDGESNFTELVNQYSGGEEAEVGGVVGPHELTIPHPALVQKMISMKSGELAAPIQIGDWFILMRLEKHLPAKLGKEMRLRLVNELCEQWIQSQLNQLIVSKVSYKQAKNIDLNLKI